MESSVIGRINALRQMTVAELQAEWLKLYGARTRSRNRVFLWKHLAWRTQELAHGGLSEGARAKMEILSDGVFQRGRTPIQARPAPTTQAATAKVRDIRMPPPGSVLTREYRGRELRLVVREDHFEFDGQAFKSLSAAARHVTGARWNGRLFWGLVKRRRS